MINRIFQSCILLPSLLLVLCCSSCLNKETAVPLAPHVPGEEEVASVSLSSDYRFQVFYNLKNNTVVGSNKYTAWDLGFESGATGWHVVMNTARFMKVFPTAKTDFAAVQLSDTVGVPGLFDGPSGNLDSTAFGDWRDGKVYIIGRGFDEAGEYQGMAKIKVMSSDAAGYHVRFSGIDGSNDKTITIAKNDQYNFSFLSFDKGETLLIEPPKTDWDIVLTKYTHIYYELNNMPYSVVGCMLNRYQTTAAIADSLKLKFSDLKIDDALKLSQKQDINTIGFDWKTYTGTTYTVDTNKHFVIRNSEGLYFKLRFIGFLDKTGVKGSPAWEYQRL